MFSLSLSTVCFNVPFFFPFNPHLTPFVSFHQPFRTAVFGKAFFISLFPLLSNRYYHLLKSNHSLPQLSTILAGNWGGGVFKRLWNCVVKKYINKPTTLLIGLWTIILFIPSRPIVLLAVLLFSVHQKKKRKKIQMFSVKPLRVYLGWNK